MSRSLEAIHGLTPPLREAQGADMHFHAAHRLGLKPVLPQLVEPLGLQLPLLLLPAHELRPRGAPDLARTPRLSSAIPCL